jgi:serine/threonine protein kinase/tetratricopeptide (TPR) repeat protein
LAAATISHYRILKKLGAGGMGEVYLAEDSRLGRKVALKLLSDELTKNEDRLHRFEQEARAASALSHPNILTIYDIGEEGSARFIATEYIEGETLRQHLSRTKMSLREALEIAVQIASALDAAHQAAIVHRDIKPENVMIRPGGHVKVLDFGLAKLTEQPISTDTEAPTIARVDTEPGTVMGTADYMSPEQARGLNVDTRTDIFSLGVVIYEMVAGRRPFEGTTKSHVVVSILEKEPPPIARYAEEVPPELERIVAKALVKDRDERYQVVKDLLIDLKSLKHELEFEAKLERSLSPEMMSTVIPTAAAGRLPVAKETTSQVGQSTARSMSSAEYIVSEIKQHKKSALVITLVALAVAASLFYFFSRKTAALTEKDTVVLADFINTTGDAVFDGTLKQALAVQLGQSPFFNILSDQQVRDALRFMGRSRDDRVTKDVAREICERQGIKAMLAGSISGLGSHYVITLEALNGHTGEAIAREQAEAESKEQVLKKLGDAATKLREKLGESLSSVQKFDAPVEQATTASLEALRAFSLGDEQRAKGNNSEAIPFYKRATELDPNFALAYARTAVMYFNLRQPESAAEFTEKAFALRERVSEHERLYIEARYYTDVLGDFDKTLEILEIWKRTFPRDNSPWNNSALRANQLGQYEKAVEEARESVRLDPNFPNGYINLSVGFLGLNRFDEAKDVIDQAMSRRLDTTTYHTNLFAIAFVRGDSAGMQQQVEWGVGKPGESLMLNAQAQAAISSGQLRKAREFSGRAVDLAQRRDSKELAASHASSNLYAESAFGNCQQTKESIQRALSFARSRVSLKNAALALAICGEVSDAQPLADELTRRFPKDTFVNATWLPTIQGAIETNRNNAAQAIQLLQAASRDEMGTVAGLWPAYVRGLAFLQQRSGPHAMAEFQKILDHRGVVAVSPLYPLAHIGLARAAVLTGDNAKARKAYQDFFALWKDADPDVPVLVEARKEYDKLK